MYPDPEVYRSAMGSPSFRGGVWSLAYFMLWGCFVCESHQSNTGWDRACQRTFYHIRNDVFVYSFTLFELAINYDFKHFFYVAWNIKSYFRRDIYFMLLIFCFYIKNWIIIMLLPRLYFLCHLLFTQMVLLWLFNSLSSCFHSPKCIVSLLHNKIISKGAPPTHPLMLKCFTVFYHFCYM